MQLQTGVNTYLSLREGKHIPNFQALILAKSGYGKSHFTEGIAEKLWKNGYLVIVLSDPKDEMEFCYQMFEPREPYHLDLLRKLGKKPEAKPIKIYHPFSFNIPNILHPEITLYTFSLKQLGRKEFGLLAETSLDSEAIELLLQASENITKEDGIYGLLHYVQRIVSGNKAEKEKKPDPQNFLLEVSGGTAKSVTEISKYMQSFRKDYFLTKENCSLNLDFKTLLQDQKHYHVFVSHYIRDKKLKSFIVLALLEGILRNKEYLKCPLVLIIPEARIQCPFKPQGYSEFLCKSIKDSLSILRSSGRGISSVLDSQSFSSLDKDVRDSSTVIFLGELGADAENVAKVFNYKRDIRSQLTSMDYPHSFLLVGKEDVGGISIFPSSSMHSEEHYSFYDEYKKQCGNKMRKYNDIYGMMKRMYQDEENKFKEQIKRRQKQEKLRREKLAKEKEIAKSETEEVKKESKDVKDIKNKSKEQLIKLCCEVKKRNPKLSYREIRDELISLGFQISHVTIKNYLEKYFEESDENSEDDVPEELSE